MILSERTIISQTNILYKECDELCLKTKNLYNFALFINKKEYETTGKHLNYIQLNKFLSETKQKDYIALKAKVAQQVLMLLDRHFNYFFKSLELFKKNPSSFNGKPSSPKFLNKKSGRFVAIFTRQAISEIALKKGFVKLSGTKISIESNKNPKQARVVYLGNKRYAIEVLYEKNEENLLINSNYAGIDLGVNNLATVVFNNNTPPIIINGKPLKSINQYYNKKRAEYQSKLPKYKNNNEVKQKYNSKKLCNLTHKRNCKITDYLHKATCQLAKDLKQSNISKVVIGKNKQWKHKINIGGKNNQNFVSIPYNKFIHFLTYKLKLIGIETICREESYTSKCSFLDNEFIIKHDNYKGKRVTRGMFKSENGILWNADCNGACNILKKEVPNAFANGIEGVLVHPRKHSF